ncbi:type VI secretion system protein TssA [Vibrio kasasachensis]|uniref:type VI secretion system protein TssA n=1 Tax=Vibrio kasasachensis TaxID=2910248 RepID=UPI003D13E5E7
MKLNNYCRYVTQPIQADNPVGKRLVDEPLYDFIEDQMMKVGSLSHTSVQWEKVEQSTLKLLGEKSKDLKLLIYLLQCLHNDATPVRFITSIELVTHFMNLYWDGCFPVPGEKGRVTRGKFFGQIVQRFSLAIGKLDFSQFSHQERNDLTLATEAWLKTTIKQGVSSDGVESLVTKIGSQQQRATERENVDTHEEETSVVEQISTVKSAVSIDSSSDKATKQSILKVADFLSQQEFGTDLAIRVRRYAVWSSITSLPEHAASGETQLRGMMQERVKEYQDHMRSPDLVLWQKVEQSLTMAPFWFEGQMMSYQIAQSLGKESWCDAILSESEQFLARMPMLLDLKFKGGEPFISEAVKQWLLSYKNAGGSNSLGGTWQEKGEEAAILAKEGGIAVALSMLNDGLLEANEPRDKFYWRLLSADLLNANSLDAMAKEQYQTLHSQITTMSVIDWEPSLVEQLEQYTTSQ